MRAIALFTALLATAPAAPGAPPRARRVQLELAGVLPVGDGAGALLVLREKGARTILPLLLSGASGRAMASDLEARRTPGALGGALHVLGAVVQEVEFVGAEDDDGSAHARLAQGRRVVDLPGRPSELVALAVATGAPIFISRHLLDAEGLSPEDIERARRRLGAGRSDGPLWL